MKMLKRDKKLNNNLMSFFVLLFCYCFMSSSVFEKVLTARDGREIIRPKPNFDKLTVWIEGKEIEHLLGFPLDIFIIQDGAVEAYLQDAYMDNHLPILPPEVTQVEISWMARDGKYLYKFPDLRSLDPPVMFDPLMSIPTYGEIPSEKDTFHITLSCTGEKTGIASMYLSLGIVNSRGLHIKGSPVKLHIRKRCIAFAESKTDCEGKCKNGGTCESGKCSCKKGYLGTFCQNVACYPACENNGTCVKHGKCVCQKGYSGSRCQRVKCRNKCSGRGTCIAPNTCSCPTEFYGDICQFRKDSLINGMITVLTPVEPSDHNETDTESETKPVDLLPFAGSCPTPCENDGFCTEKNVCKCRKGYTGDHCKTPVCKKSCGLHGYCVELNRCECHTGWRGRTCHKEVKKVINLNPENRRKHGRSRNQRHTKKNKNKKKKRKRKRPYV